MFNWVFRILHAIFKSKKIEIGERITIRVTSPFSDEVELTNYEWRDVLSISYEFNMETGKEAFLIIEKQNNSNTERDHQHPPFRPTWGAHYSEAWGGRHFDAWPWTKLEFSPHELNVIAQSLLSQVDISTPESRERVVHGLQKIGCVEYYIVSPIANIYEAYDSEIGQMRADIAAKLDELLNDTDERVRTAAALALTEVKRRIVEERN